MEDSRVLAIDLGKNEFQLCVVSKSQGVHWNRRVRRAKLLEQVVQSGETRVVMEACAGSHYWARELSKQGLSVELIAPQHVKPFVRRHKTDARDAEAIGVAALQGHICRVAIKSSEQQQLQMLHRIRTRLVKQRTELINEVRGMLMEEGIVLAKTRVQFKKVVVDQFGRLESKLEGQLRYVMSELIEEYQQLNERIEGYEKRIKRYFQQNEACQRIGKIEGIGYLSATAIVAAVGHQAQGFKDSKHFSAWLGLTPRQHSSGGKTKILGISKRGDSYIRQLLIHGARNVVRWTNAKRGEKHVIEHPRRRWICKKTQEQMAFNKISVAYARKNARVVWKLLSSGEQYRYAA